MEGECTDMVHAEAEAEFWERWRSGQCVADIALASGSVTLNHHPVRTHNGTIANG